MKQGMAWILTLMVLVAGLFPVGAADNGPWQLVLENEIKHFYTLAGYLNDSFGITVGYQGLVYVTTDGGRTWSQAENNSMCRFGLEIVNERIAWNCGNGGHVRKSIDGGRTWSAVKNFGLNEPEHCQFLSFIDEQTGWIAAPSFSLAETRDGGQSWNELELPEEGGRIAAISLRTANEGYVLDVKGNLFVTSDGGKSWDSRNLGLKGKELLSLGAPMTAMRFTDADHGVIIASLRGGEIWDYATKDAGKTWSGTKLPFKPGIVFLTRDAQWLTVTYSIKGMTRVYRRVK